MTLYFYFQRNVLYQWHPAKSRDKPSKRLSGFTPRTSEPVEIPTSEQGLTLTELAQRYPLKRAA